MNTLVPAATLARALIAQTGCFAMLKDASYHLTTEDFVAGPFTESYADFLRLFDLEVYDAESNDCDKFALYARAVAQALNARTVKAAGAEKGALAFGDWDYYPEWARGQGHEICWFARGVPVTERFPDGIEILYYDALPTMQKIVRLTPTEIQSGFQCAQ